MIIIGVVVVALYEAISSGFGTVRLARENLRATQILVEKMEAIRLYDWDQLNAPGFIPNTFSAAYDPIAKDGATYYGTLTVSPAALNASYSDDLRLVTVQLTWTSGQLTRKRELSTYVCRTGLQNYIY